MELTEAQKEFMLEREEICKERETFEPFQIQLLDVLDKINISIRDISNCIASH